MSRFRTLVAFAALSGLASAGTSACASDAVPLTRSANTPGITRVVGPVRGTVCDNPYDAVKGQAKALEQLQALAVEHGGNGVTGVRFAQVTNRRSPCWHGVEATGLAVIYAR
jgi:hypothetical protein